MGKRSFRLHRDDLSHDSVLLVKAEHRFEDVHRLAPVEVSARPELRHASLPDGSCPLKANRHLVSGMENVTLRPPELFRRLGATMDWKFA